MDELSVELAAVAPEVKRLDCVAVTPTMRMWHAFRTLELVYRDAYQNQLNDRYAGKRDQFSALGKWALDKMLTNGIGIISNPIPKAAAADLTYFSGQQAGTTYYVCTSWTGAQGEEGAVGEWNAISTPDGSVLCVRPVNPPMNAAGWNVFVGLSPDSITQQNEEPLGLAQPWLQEMTITTTGRTPHKGQTADYLRTVTQMLQRG
jgi:hypothetical protein